MILRQKTILDRRSFISLLAGATLDEPSRSIAGKAALYAAVGRELTHYDVDVAGAALTRRGSVTLPAGIQYAWPHASRKYLYVASSDGVQGAAGTHHLSAFRIDVHPGGRFLYVANRADGTTNVGGEAVFAGGENNIAVYSIDARTGEPTLIQHADTRGIHARTFHLDRGGRILVAANLMPLRVREGTTLSTMPAGLTVFRIGGDGRLDYVRKYDIEVGKASLFWVGMLELRT